MGTAGVTEVDMEEVMGEDTVEADMVVIIRSRLKLLFISCKIKEVRLSVHAKCKFSSVAMSDDKNHNIRKIIKD